MSIVKFVPAKEREKFGTVKTGDDKHADGFPMPDKVHARAALADIDKSDLSPAQKAKVKAKARALLADPKFPERRAMDKSIIVKAKDESGHGSEKHNLTVKWRRGASGNEYADTSCSCGWKGNPTTTTFSAHRLHENHVRQHLQKAKDAPDIEKGIGFGQYDKCRAHTLMGGSTNGTKPCGRMPTQETHTDFAGKVKVCDQCARHQERIKPGARSFNPLAKSVIVKTKDAKGHGSSKRSALPMPADKHCKDCWTARTHAINAGHRGDMEIACEAHKGAGRPTFTEINKAKDAHGHGSNGKGAMCCPRIPGKRYKLACLQNGHDMRTLKAHNAEKGGVLEDTGIKSCIRCNHRHGTKSTFRISNPGEEMRHLEKSKDAKGHGSTKKPWWHGGPTLKSKKTVEHGGTNFTVYHHAHEPLTEKETAHKLAAAKRMGFEATQDIAQGEAAHTQHIVEHGDKVVGHASSTQGDPKKFEGYTRGGTRVHAGGGSDEVMRHVMDLHNSKMRKGVSLMDLVKSHDAPANFNEFMRAILDEPDHIVEPDLQPLSKVLKKAGRKAGTKPGALAYRTPTGYDVVHAEKEHPIGGGHVYEVHPRNAHQKLGEIYANPIVSMGAEGVVLQPHAIGHDGTNLGPHPGFDNAVHAIVSHYEQAEGEKRAETEKKAKEAGAKAAVKASARAVSGSQTMPPGKAQTVKPAKPTVGGSKPLKKLSDLVAEVA